MPPEDWDFISCVIAATDLGDVRPDLLRLDDDTSISGAFPVRGKLGATTITNGVIKDVLAASRPRRFTFKVAGILHKGRIIRFADGTGLMWGHVKRARPKVDDEGEVWVATKGSGGILDLTSQATTKAARKRPKAAARKKKALKSK